MRHTRKFKFVIIAVVIVIIVMPLLCVLLWDMHIENGEIREGNYFEYDLSKLRGGEQAQLFFNEYADLSSYKEMKFYYRDSGRQISKLFNSWTVFVLDVYYEEAHFCEIINTILLDTNLPHLSPGDGYNGEEAYEYLKKDERWNDGFFDWVIVKDEPLYQNNTAGFFVDVKYQTIRYCFIYNKEDGATTFFDDMVILSIDLPWNSTYNENDWAFDYPDS